jgi:hypothetical protein
MCHSRSWGPRFALFIVSCLLSKMLFSRLFPVRNAAESAPLGATAQCRDVTYSFSGATA